MLFWPTFFNISTLIILFVVMVNSKQKLEFVVFYCCGNMIFDIPICTATKKLINCFLLKILRMHSWCSCMVHTILSVSHRIALKINRAHLNVAHPNFALCTFLYGYVDYFNIIFTLGTFLHDDEYTLKVYAKNQCIFLQLNVVWENIYIYLIQRHVFIFARRRL